MDRWKSIGGKSQRREEQKREDQRREKSQKKEDAGAGKVRKVAIHGVFPMICGSGGSKSRLATAAGAEPSGQIRDEQLHAVVARSTFASEKAENTPRLEHFWKLRCRKSARRCGAKHIWKSKCTKHESDHFWKLRCRKSARRCGAKHISKSTVEKKLRVWSTFGRSNVVLRGRHKGFCTLPKVSKTCGLCSIVNYDQYTALHYTTTTNTTTLHFTTIH